jgi:hypothetical protein
MNYGRGWLVCVGVFVVVGVATGDVSSDAATGAAPNTKLAIPGRLIAKLAAGGNRVAAMTTLKNGSCGRVVVWTTPGRKARSLNTSGCSRDCARRPKTSLCLPIVCRAGTACVDELALGGGYIAWLIRSGGNSLELRVMAAKLPAGWPKQLDVAVSGAGAAGDPNGSYLGQLLGGGALLAYNAWAKCLEEEGDPPCPPVDPETGFTQESLVRVVAGRRRVVKNGPGSYRLAAVGGGRLAVESIGTVTVLSPAGARSATIPAAIGDPVRALAMSGARIALQRKSTLELHDATTGAEVESLPLGSAAALPLVGINAKLALLAGPRRLVLVRLSDGSLTILSPPSGVARFVDAKLAEGGLFYAYNAPGRASSGRIVFEANAKVLRRF